MKAKDLKFPFSFENRTLLLQDGVFFLPENMPSYEDFSLPPWTTVFNNTNPINIEFCSGNGSWIIEKACHSPKENWIAVEKRFDRVKKIWFKTKNANLDNLLIVCGDGVKLAKYYLFDQTISHIMVNFPDPWPKNRHAKHRIMQQPFLNDVYCALKKHGLISFLSDDLDYVNTSLENLHQTAFQSVLPKPYFITKHITHNPISFFESLWRKKGRSIYYLQFSKH